MACLAACGDGNAGRDAGQSPDAPAADGGTDGSPGQTSVTGTVDGTSVTLQYADVAWGDPLSTLCASNRPITAPDCGYSDGVPKVVIYGKFAVQGGQGMWAFPQVEMRVIGPMPQVKLGNSGTMDVTVYEPAQDRFTASIDLQFDNASFAGTVVVVP